jgi:Mrp family chromosome partitioning ATPase/capsular polysaccharide biosynthesis protein
MPQSPSDLQRYTTVLRRQGWLIALIVVVTVGAAFGLTRLQQRMYEARTKVVVGQGAGLFQPQFVSAVDPFTQTMADLFKSQIVGSRVIDRLGLTMTPQELLRHLHVKTTPNSGVLAVSYNDPDKANAVRILREVSGEFTTLVKEKLGQGKGAARVTATIFDEPYAVPDPVSPQVPRTLAAAAVLGLGLGLLFAFLRSGSDNRIRTKRDAQEWFGAPVLGSLPKGSRGNRPLAQRTGRRSTADARITDAVQMLRANLQFSGILEGKTFVVTSAVPDEGKSTVTANLGVALAQAGRDVVIVEADLRRPMLMRYLDILDEAPGLADVLDGRASLNDALRSVPIDGRRKHRDPSQPGRIDGAQPLGRLRALPSGTVRGNPGDIASSDRFATLIERLKADAEYVLFDAPPLLLVGDAFSLVRDCDGVLVVARAGHTTREAAESVRSALKALGAKSIGIVISDWAVSQDEYGYGYAGGYSSDRAPVTRDSESVL